MTIADSLGAFTSYTFSLRIHLSSVINKNEIQQYLVNIEIMKISLYQDATLTIKTEKVDKQLLMCISEILTRI